MRRLILAACAATALTASMVGASAAANPAGWYVGLGMHSVSATEKNLSRYSSSYGSDTNDDTTGISGFGYDLDVTAVGNIYTTSVGTLTGLVSVNAGLNDASSSHTDESGFVYQTTLGWSGSALAGLGFYVPITDDIGVMPYAQMGLGFATGKQLQTNPSYDSAWVDRSAFATANGRVGAILTYGRWFANANYFFANGSNQGSSGHGSGYESSSSTGAVMSGFSFIAGVHWQLD